MENINLPPFYVGQKVVSIRDNPDDNYKKGARFIILGIKIGCCTWEVDVGIKGDVFMKCPRCGSREETAKIGFVKWFFASAFAPIQENFQSISLEKVLETETPLISVN